MKITFSLKQTVCWGGVHFFSIHFPVLTSSPDDVLLYDVCASEFVIHSYLIRCKYISFVVLDGDDADTHLLCKWAEKVHGDISNLAPLCPVFSQHVPPACSLGTFYPKTLHLFVNYCLCISGTSGNLHLNL